MKPINVFDLRDYKSSPDFPKCDFTLCDMIYGSSAPIERRCGLEGTISFSSLVSQKTYIACEDCASLMAWYQARDYFQSCLSWVSIYPKRPLGTDDISAIWIAHRLFPWDDEDRNDLLYGTSFS